MTEDQARAICAELGASFSIRQRKGIAYVYVSRWLPRAAAEAAGHQASRSNGQQFDCYVGPLAQLPQIDPDTLRRRIAALPQNPNKHTRTLTSCSPPNRYRGHVSTYFPIREQPCYTTPTFVACYLEALAIFY